MSLPDRYRSFRNARDVIGHLSENSLLFFLMALTFLLSIKQFLVFDSVDEVEIMNWIKDIDREGFPALKYPPLFLYLHFVLSKIYASVLSLLGFIDSPAGFLFTETGFRFTLEAGRVVNALLASLLVFMVFRTGKRFFNKNSGFLAALLIAVNPLIILYAHIFKPGILTTLLVIFVLWHLLSYMEKPVLKHISWASFFCGLAVSAKFNVFPVVISILAVIFLVPRPGNWKKYFLWIPAGGAAGFLLGAPNWLFNPIGNINRFLGQYNPGGGNLYKQVLPKRISEVWLDFAGDLILHFGVILFVLFIAAVLHSFLLICCKSLHNKHAFEMTFTEKKAAHALKRVERRPFFKKEKQGLFIIIMIVVYMQVLSFFGFFADRFGMPLFPAVALLIAKFVFKDLEPIYRRVRVNWKIITLVLWLPAVIYASGQITTNLKTYNLLHTVSEYDHTIRYRQQHNIVSNKKYNIARQLFTPRVKGKNIKLTKRFQLKFYKRDMGKTFHFIQAHLPTYMDYISGKILQDRDVIDMTRHLPFYKIEKREYQPWNPQCIYLYRVSPQLLEIIPKGSDSEPWELRLRIPEPLPLPRTFYQGEDTTFLPLQTYEQNPLYVKLNKEPYRHWLYSRKPITALKFYLYTAQPGKALHINVNDRQKVVPLTAMKPGTVTVLEIKNLRPRAYFYDYVYRLDIGRHTEDKKDGVTHIVYEPIYADSTVSGNKAAKPLPVSIPEPIEGDVPELFSNGIYPGWVKRVYRQSGIDLSLLRFLSARSYVIDSKTSPVIIPLQRGVYRVTVVGQSETDSFLEYRIGGGKKKVPVLGNCPRTIHINAPYEQSFFTFNSIQSLLITITPDYRHYFETRQ